MTTLEHAFATPLSVGIAGGVATVRVAGDVDIVATDELRSALEVLIAQRVERIDVDLAAARRIDSEAVELLARIHARLAARGGRLAVTAADDHVASLLRRRGVSGLLGVR